MQGAPVEGAPVQVALWSVGSLEIARVRLAQLERTNRRSDFGFAAFTERGSLSLKWKSSEEEQSHTAQNSRQMGLWC